jgi:hypothetical protein
MIHTLSVKYDNGIHKAHGPPPSCKTFTSEFNEKTSCFCVTMKREGNSDLIDQPWTLVVVSKVHEFPSLVIVNPTLIRFKVPNSSKVAKRKTKHVFEDRFHLIAEYEKIDDVVVLVEWSLTYDLLGSKCPVVKDFLVYSDGHRCMKKDSSLSKSTPKLSSIYKLFSILKKI